VATTQASSAFTASYSTSARGDDPSEVAPQGIKQLLYVRRIADL
jgi:hypothetical protein